MDPLQQIQQLLEAQQRFWQALHPQSDSRPNHNGGTEHSSGANSHSDFHSQINDTAEQLSQHAKTYSEFAQTLVEQLQKSDGAVDQAALFLDALTQFREQTLLDDFQIPPGYEAFFKTLNQGISGSLALTALKGQWNRQIERIRARVVNSQDDISAFQTALSRFNQLEQELNQQVHSDLMEAFRSMSGDDLSESSLTALIDQWVDTYESHYQRLLATEEYQQAYQSLLTCTTQLQQRMQQSWDEEYRTAGLTPNQDYADLLKKHHQLEKRYRQQQQQLSRLEAKLDQVLVSATDSSVSEDHPTASTTIEPTTP